MIDNPPEQLDDMLGAPDDDNNQGSRESDEERENNKPSTLDEDHGQQE